MKFLKSFKPSHLAIAVVAAATLSSCNRGMGCPTNFSIGEVAGGALHGLVATLGALF